MGDNGLSDLPGVGPATARRLRRRGLRTREQLRRRLDELPPAARAELRYRPAKRVPLETAKRLARRLARCLRLPGRRPGAGFELLPVGSVRRGEAAAGDLDLLLVVPDRWEERLDELALAAEDSDAAGDSEVLRVDCSDLRALTVYAGGERRQSFVLRDARAGRNYRVDIFLALARERPYALFHYTGPRSYNVRTRAHAKRQGYRLNQYGLWADGRRAPNTRGLRTEAQLARRLGLTARPPAARE
jgi:DNA polymerase (family 10)